MVMRYHWGLAIGHTYSHAAAAGSAVPVHAPAADTLEDELASDSANMLVEIPLHQNEENPDYDNPELGFENREDDYIDGEEGDLDEGSMEPNHSGDDDDEFLDYSDMYGPSYD
jgi:hypothetical protein